MVEARLKFDRHTGFFLAQHLPDKMHAAGRMLGFSHPWSIETSGTLAGLRAAADCGVDTNGPIAETLKNLATLQGPARGCNMVMAPVKGRKTFICFDEDTTIKNIKQALEMGFDAAELIKRFTAAGTGPGQGGIPGHNLPLFVAQYHADSTVSARPTTVRAPLVPTLIATYAGRNHDMSKRTPMHSVQKSDGGIMRRIGVWRRARYFSKDFTCKEEIENVRNNVGLLDASTLGKLIVNPVEVPVRDLPRSGDRMP